jgi:hypothetical protein
MEFSSDFIHFIGFINKSTLPFFYSSSRENFIHTSVDIFGTLLLEAP